MPGFIQKNAVFWKAKEYCSSSPKYKLKHCFTRLHFSWSRSHSNWLYPTFAANTFIYFKGSSIPWFFLAIFSNRLHWKWNKLCQRGDTVFVQKLQCVETMVFVRNSFCFRYALPFFEGLNHILTFASTAYLSENNCFEITPSKKCMVSFNKMVLSFKDKNWSDCPFHLSNMWDYCKRDQFSLKETDLIGNMRYFLKIETSLSKQHEWNKLKRL